MFSLKKKSKRVRRMEMRKRAKFWDKYGDPIRVSLIAAAAITGASLLAKMALG